MRAVRLLSAGMAVLAAIACGGPADGPGARLTGGLKPATEGATGTADPVSEDGMPGATEGPTEATAAGPIPGEGESMWERLAQAPDAGPPQTTTEFVGDVVVKGDAVIAFGLAQDEPAAWRSADAGATWGRIPAFDGFRKGYIPAATVLEDGTVLAVGVGQPTEPEDEFDDESATRVWTSADGSSFEPADIRDALDYPIAVTSTSEAAVVVMHGGGVWRSVDSGRSWEQAADGSGYPIGLGDLGTPDGLVSLPDDGLVALTDEEGGRRFVSTDSGQSWKSSPAHNIHPPADADGYHLFERVRSMPDGTIIAAGTSYLGTPVDQDSILLRSRDQGATWAADDLTGAGGAVGPGDQVLYDVVPVGGGLLAIGKWATGDDDGPGAWWSPDGGPTWVAVHPPMDLAFQPLAGEEPLSVELVAAAEIAGAIVVLGTQEFYDSPTDYQDVTAWRLTLPAQ